MQICYSPTQLYSPPAVSEPAQSLVPIIIFRGAAQPQYTRARLLRILTPHVKIESANDVVTNANSQFANAFAHVVKNIPVRRTFCGGNK